MGSYLVQNLIPDFGKNTPSAFIRRTGHLAGGMLRGARNLIDNTLANQIMAPESYAQSSLEFAACIFAGPGNVLLPIPANKPVSG